MAFQVGNALSNLDISGPMLRGQQFRANALNIQDAEQKLSDRNQLRKLRGQYIGGDTGALRQIATISPAEAAGVSKALAGIQAMENSSQLFQTKEKAKAAIGFAAYADTPEKWKSGLSDLKGILSDKEINWIGNEFSDSKRQLIAGIYGEFEKAADFKLTEIGVGDGMKQKAFVRPGRKPQTVGDPYPAFKPSESEGPKKLKATDSRFFDQKARNLFDQMVNPLTGDILNKLEGDQKEYVTNMAADAENIFQQRDITRNQAWKIVEDRYRRLFKDLTTGNKNTTPKRGNTGNNDPIGFGSYLDRL